MSPERGGQELLENALLAPSTDSPEYQAAKEEMRYLAGPRGLDVVLEEGEGLDAIMVIGHGKHSLAAMAGAPIGMSHFSLSFPPYQSLLSNLTLE